jgi:hypothetical protein
VNQEEQLLAELSAIKVTKAFFREKTLALAIVEVFISKTRYFSFQRKKVFSHFFHFRIIKIV